MGTRSHKANPDEKGTESKPNFFEADAAHQRVTKPIPMKRELKGRNAIGSSSRILGRHKANPDEKGTERSTAVVRYGKNTVVTKPIPMKRELKVSGSSYSASRTS